MLILVFCFVLFCFVFIFLREFPSVTPAKVQWCDLGSLQLPPPGISVSCASASRVTGTTGICHQTWIIFVFLVEMGICHVNQAGLELLASSDPPASTF